MTDSELRDRFNRLPLNELRNVQLEHGRLNLPEHFRVFWTEEHRIASTVASDVRHSLIVRKMAKLLREITFSIATLPPGEYPNYFQYTNSHLLDWFVAPETATLPQIKQRAFEGYCFLLRDLLEFEADSLGGVSRQLRENFDRTWIFKRFDFIEEAFQAARQAAVETLDIPIDPEHDVPQLTTLEEYATQESRLSAVLRFTSFPLTQNHDEIVFQRVLHGSELCFLGIRACLTGAIEAIKQDGFDAAAKDLRHATSFAHLLHLLLKVLKTMPKEHFAAFRDYTGKASALQSLNYHLLDIYFRGVNTDKAPDFSRVDHLKPLFRYAHPGFVSLRQALDRAKTRLKADSALFQAAKELDKQLLTWRGLHLSFAKTYIPMGAAGTGGTTGAAYLHRFLYVGLFDDTEPDMRIVRDIFPETTEVPDIFRIFPRQGVAPREDLRSRPAHDAPAPDATPEEPEVPQAEE